MASRVLYVIVCGSPIARGVGTLVGLAQHEGWDVCVVSTPDGRKFLDVPGLAAQTGHPVRWRFKNPGEPDLLPDADAMIVAPATVNTIAKWSAGIADTLPLGLLVEGIGKRLPIVAMPFTNTAMAAHPAFMESMGRLRSWGVTIAAIRVPRSEASAFGIIDASADRNVVEFIEKPKDPPGLPGSPDESFASMGNYVFTTEALLEVLKIDAEDDNSVHDMGGSIIPLMVKQGSAYVYDFADNDVPGAEERDRGYWRDVGTLDAYYDAHMDLVAVHPIFNLYNQLWPIYTHPPQLPPAKFVEGGIAQESIVSSGTIVAGATVRNSVISPNVRLHAGAYVESSVIMDNAQIGRGAVIRRTILDKNVVVPDGAHIGVEPDLDKARYKVTESGIVVLGKSQLALP